MKKRKLLLNKPLIDYQVGSEIKNSSLSNVIKTTKNVLLSQGYRRKNQKNQNNNHLKSIITSHKEVQNPLSKILFNDDKYQLMKLFYNSFRDKFDKKENFGYISKNNAVILQNYRDLFKKTLDSDLHIFNSDQVRIRWFLVNCKSGNSGFSKRLSQLIDYDEMGSSVDEKISFLLLQPTFLVNDILITKSFLIIY
uniref:Uncharacterized protein n=1 Tax=Theileria annulata TaxID=5874 RepID=A0A3B0N4W4_THEAN